MRNRPILALLLIPAAAMGGQQAAVPDDSNPGGARAGRLVAEDPELCRVPNPPAAPARFTPWIYNRDDGSLVWGRHQFYEDHATTVFTLARDLVTLADQEGSYPEALLFNIALFDPPEGMEGSQPRRLLRDSIYKKGLQLYVNYVAS